MALYSFVVCCAHLMSILHSFRRSPAEVQVAFTVSSEVIKKCEACDVSVFLSVLTKTDRICLLTVVSTSFLPRSLDVDGQDRQGYIPRITREENLHHQRHIACKTQQYRYRFVDDPATRRIALRENHST